MKKATGVNFHRGLIILLILASILSAVGSVSVIGNLTKLDFHSLGSSFNLIRIGIITSSCISIFIAVVATYRRKTMACAYSSMILSLAGFFLSFSFPSSDISANYVINTVARNVESYMNLDSVLEALRNKESILEMAKKGVFSGFKELANGTKMVLFSYLIINVISVVIFVLCICMLVQQRKKTDNRIETDTTENKSGNHISNDNENEEFTVFGSKIDADISSNEAPDSNQQSSTLAASWSCNSCGNTNDVDARFCSNCGATYPLGEASQITQNSLNTQQNILEEKKKPNKKGLIIRIVSGLLVTAGLVVFLVMSYAKPTFKGKTSSSDLMNAAQKYVDSDEFVYQYNTDYQTRFTITRFKGQISDYYQFGIVGKQINKTTGEVTTITTYDNIAIVLTEKENGITFVPISKWIYKDYPTKSEYSERKYYACVVKMSYDYATGKPYVVVRFYNNTNSDVVFPKISVEISDNNGRIAYETFDIDQTVRANSYIDKYLEFSGNSFKFCEDVSGIHWKTEY